jgi:hypothetical protein
MVPVGMHLEIAISIEPCYKSIRGADAVDQAAAKIDPAEEESCHHYVAIVIYYRFLPNIYSPISKAFAPEMISILIKPGKKYIALSRTRESSPAEVDGSVEKPADDDVTIGVDSNGTSILVVCVSEPLAPEVIPENVVLRQIDIIAPCRSQEPSAEIGIPIEFTRYDHVTFGIDILTIGGIQSLTTHSLAPHVRRHLGCGRHRQDEEKKKN